MKKKQNNQSEEIFGPEFLIKTLANTQSALDSIVKDSERKTHLLNKLSDSILVIVENLKTIKDKVDSHDGKLSEIENQIKLISLLLDGIQERDVLISNNHIHLKEIKYAVQEMRDKVNILAFQEKKEIKGKKKFSFTSFTLALYEGVKNVKAILLLLALILSIIAYFFGADFVEQIKAQAQ